MRKKRDYRWLKAVSVLSFSLLFFVDGCAEKSGSSFTDAELERVSLAQRVKLLEQAGGLVLIVGGEPITSDEIINYPVEKSGGTVPLIDVLKPAAQISNLEQFKKQAGGRIDEIVTNKISDILLYHLAKSRVGENIDEALERAADAEMRKFVLSCGGDEAKADEKLEQMGLDRKSFKEQQKRLMLAQSQIMEKLSGDSPVTYGELLDCYNQMKEEFFVIPARVQFRLIDIQPAMLELADPNENQRGLARQLADRLLQRLRQGEDFGELAKQYSHGHRRRFGGLWVPLQPQSLAEPYDALVDEIEKTEPGEVADLVETPEHIFIMKLEKRHPKSYKPLEQVQRQVEQKVVSDRWVSVVNKLNAGLEKNAAIGEKDEFIDFCLEKIYRISNQ